MFGEGLRTFRPFKNTKSVMDISDEDRDQQIADFIAYSKAQSTGVKRRKPSSGPKVTKKKRHRKYLSLPFRPKQKEVISKEAELAEAQWASDIIPEDEHDDIQYIPTFTMEHVNGSIDATSLKRGDLIFIVDHELIDTDPLDLDTFRSKYQTPNFLKRTTLRLNTKRSEYLNVEDIEECELYDDQNGSGIGTDCDRSECAHCMIVLQSFGVSVEVAHVTVHGGTRSFIRQFDAEWIAKTVSLRQSGNGINDDEKGMDIGNGNGNRNELNVNNKGADIVEALGRGPPVAYRAAVYRLQSQANVLRTVANEAGNVAENLVKSGRVLGAHHHDVPSERDAEQQFYKYLLDDDGSLFRRQQRIRFDEGTGFFNFSSAEFVALCFQRALVNKKSFDQQVIRILNLDPHCTKTAVLQKYLHLNIDEHGDWKCLGNMFFSYL